MLEQDIPHAMMPLPPVLVGVANFLDTYDMSVGVNTDYHAAEDDGDLTDFAVYAPTPVGEFVKRSLLVARVDSTQRHLVFHGLRNFRGKPLQRNLTPYQFRQHVTMMGDRLAAYGFDRARLAEYYQLLNTWDKHHAAHATLADILTVMALPLEVFDKQVVLNYGAELLPEMSVLRHMPRSYLEQLFALETLREQDIVYASMKRHGRVRPNA